MKANHRPRPDPYPDELDELFCDEDETLCTEDRPCMCCWADRQESRAPAVAAAPESGMMSGDSREASVT